MKFKLKASIFSVNSSPEAIVYLVQKALFTYKIKQNYSRRSPEFCGNALKLGLSE